MPENDPRLQSWFDSSEQIPDTRIGNAKVLGENSRGSERHVGTDLVLKLFADQLESQFPDLLGLL